MKKVALFFYFYGMGTLVLMGAGVLQVLASGGSPDLLGILFGTWVPALAFGFWEVFHSGNQPVMRNISVLRRPGFRQDLLELMSRKRKTFVDNGEVLTIQVGFPLFWERLEAKVDNDRIYVTGPYRQVRKFIRLLESNSFLVRVQPLAPVIAS